MITCHHCDLLLETFPAHIHNRTTEIDPAQPAQSMAFITRLAATASNIQVRVLLHEHQLENHLS